MLSNFIENEKQIFAEVILEVYWLYFHVFHDVINVNQKHFSSEATL